MFMFVAVYSVTCVLKLHLCFCSDQLSTARSHVDNFKHLSSRLSELEDLFRSPHTGDTWSVGTALGTVISRLNSALSSFDALEIPAESLLVDDDALIVDENTKRVDDNCRELRESIMLVVQSLYKAIDDDSKGRMEDRQMDSDEGNVGCTYVINDGNLNSAIIVLLMCSLCKLVKSNFVLVHVITSVVIQVGAVQHFIHICVIIAGI